MELKRLGKALAGNWLTVLTVALLGLATALMFARLEGQSREPLWQATIPLRFEPFEGETVADLADDIDEAQTLARIAAEDLLEEDPTALIETDLADARLLFIAQGRSPEIASEKAQALVQSFLEIDPTIGGAVDDLLVELEDEADTIQQQLLTLQPPFTPAEEELLSQHNLLDLQLERIQGRLIELVIVEAGALTAEERLAVSSERAALMEQMDTLSAEKAALPPPPERQLTSQEQLLVNTLTARMESLNAQYQRLYLRKLGVTGSEIIEQIQLEDLTPAPTDPLMNAAIGLGGGLLIAMFAVLMLTRTRQTVWLPEDLEIPVLGEVPGRRIGPPGDVWYDTAEPGPRKTAIQALRSAVQAQLAGSEATFALSGRAASPEGVQALAVDLACAMASAGDSILLIDADFETGATVGEFEVGGTTLAELLRLDPAAPDFEDRVRSSVVDAGTIRPGVAVIPQGPAPSSGADALAGRQFRTLVGAAKAHYDAVIVVVDPIGTPSAQVAMQRLGNGILVLTPGKTTVPEVEGVLEDAMQLRISILGAVFMGKHDRLFARSGSRRPAPPEDVESVGVPAPAHGATPAPEPTRSSEPAHDSLAHLGDRIGALPQEAGSGLGTELLATLSGSSPTRAYEAVADYLVTRTEDLVRGDSHYENGAQSGFMTLRPLPGKVTVAEWIRREIEREVGDEEAGGIVEEMERVLSRGSSSSLDIDDWLSQEFMRRHLRRTGGEPYIWHLSSPAGTVGVLADARRLDAGRIADMLGGVAGAKQAEIDQQRRDAESAGQPVDAYVESESDVRAFEEALSSVIADRWSPHWDAGLRINLAPLQAAGLLPFAILDRDEMAALGTYV